MTDQDVRWKQRFSNYLKALDRLTKAVELAGERPLSDLEEQGMIQGFEFTHELAWNVLKDFLKHQGISNLIGSKDAVRSAFQNGLIEDGDIWMSMILDRNRSSHTYNEDTAREIATKILEDYHPAFRQMAERFKTIRDKYED
ncbi:nucleotidyltransferase substrate binding protein [Maridesulfovibrio sp.]|uniref:nucleotidyltransferase substrate binding protein n=1 Tax=Maridesulfovibrio sp. TaxID=2795000 RepID=UPI002A1894EF|nr:nucleotidyltransferase substrate binding protein [Maridesulfovibrio sp.]